MAFKLLGLVAATHTPFDANGTLNLAAVERQAEHLVHSGVHTVFVAGSTGESSSLTVEERLALARRWSEVIQGTKLKLVVHVGANCLADAAHARIRAQAIGANAIAALAPSYFKPKSVEALVACCVEVAAAAPGVPFYFYDIPILTGVQLPMPEFLARASERIPTLNGVKFTNPDLMAFQHCRHIQDGRFDVAWGLDEYLSAALCRREGAVGSTYNFVAPSLQSADRCFRAGGSGDCSRRTIPLGANDRIGDSIWVHRGNQGDHGLSRRRCWSGPASEYGSDTGEKSTTSSRPRTTWLFQLG